MPSPTRQQLLLAALKLFAENGIHAVSLRSINQAAGARNSGAVHYHFDSKLGLLSALVDDLMQRIVQYRGDALERLSARHTPPTVEDCLDAFFRPLWLLHFDPEVGNVATKFFLQLHITPIPEIQRQMAERGQVSWQQVEALLLRALPHKRRAQLRLHIGMGWISVLNGLAALDLMAVTPLGDMRTGSLEEMMPAFMAYLVAGISA
ncbi:TetR/AcrR family transcriptional regulator [Chitinivorax sp. PXF-14]|uniref:TetR/AcrR family transcriptional regulator n=1 Tax=Chitinivorax sp. PXF-14 TaxID=3230488 RepID=UPI003467C516